MPHRPEPGDCPDYYFRYIDLAPGQDVLRALTSEMERTQSLLTSISSGDETTRYQPGKWSVREVVGHIIDVERVFANRAFHFARCDAEPLPGMDQDDYNDASNAGSRPLQELATELRAVRAATLALFGGFSDETWTRVGTASGYQFSVRAFPYIIAGHEVHHRHILQERYLPVMGASD